MSTERTPIYLLTGFLGAGKTTLLNALLRDARYANTAVMVNEFGAIGLDHLLVAQATDNVVLLQAGCLCCTIGESLHETLADLALRRAKSEVPAFERVIIETTGLADPASILHTLLGHRLVTDIYRLHAVLTLVDAQHLQLELAQHQETAKQIAVADRLIIAKCDLVPANQLDVVRRLLATLNAAAEAIESRAGDGAARAFAPNLALVTWREMPHQHAAHAHDAGTLDVNRHDRHIAAHCLSIDGTVSWIGVAQWCELIRQRFGARMIRCKALLKIDTGESVLLQGVQGMFHAPHRFDTWPDADPRGKLVCILRDGTDAELRTTLRTLTQTELATA